MRKLFTLTLLAISLACFNTYSQCNCSGDIRLTSQAQVNSFCCTEIAGSLTISGADITNLQPLSTLRSLKTSLNSNTGIFGLIIDNNQHLRNIDGLSGLTEMEGPVQIINNPALETINGFSGIKNLIGNLQIENNSALQTINGFKGLTQIVEFENFNALLSITNNGKLASVNGFSSLKVIDGRAALLIINDNISLIGFDGLKSLTVMESTGRGATIDIENNSVLKNIDGLSGLSRFSWGPSGTIVINNNAALENVDGLSSLTDAVGPLEAFQLMVQKNSSLTRCCGLFPLLNSFDLTAENQPIIEIADNGSGCTKEDILAAGACQKSTCACSGNIFLRSQAAVDSFHCTEISGSLTIGGPDIKNLDALSSLQIIKSKFVGEAFYAFGLSIRNNPELNNLHGLSSLTNAEGFIEVLDNPSLKSINGFSKLKTIAGSITIQNNESLETINGFKNLTQILPFQTMPSALSIGSNANLTNLKGFSSLKEIKGNGSALLLIYNNQALSTIDGLSSLSVIEGGDQLTSIFIDSNGKLKNIDGLSGLTRFSWGMSGEIIITGNLALDNVDGLSSLTDVIGEPSALTINAIGNTSLTRCCGLFPLLNSFDPESTSQPTIEIRGNGSGCTREDILLAGTCQQSGRNSRISVSISPIPTVGELSIQVNNGNETNFQIMIMNANGQIFHKAPHDPRTNNAINTTNLPSGLYYLIVSDNEGFSKSIEFVKK
jgi:hypothetical protein